MRHRGSVIILVLVTILLAGFLLATFLQRAGTELLADARAAQRGRLQREAYSALEVTLAVLADARTRGNANTTEPGWDKPLEYAGYHPRGVQVQVSVEDETNKLSLPASDQDTLAALFASLGIDGLQAGRASDALLAWTRPNDGKGLRDHDYERELPPHRPAQRPLRSYEELASVAVVRDLLFDGDGRPNDKFHGFAAAVSLHSFMPANPGSASALVRTAPRQNSNAPATPRNQRPAEPDIVRINITATAGSIVYRMTAVVGTGGSSFLFRVLEVREDLPNPTAVLDRHA